MTSLSNVSDSWNVWHEALSEADRARSPDRATFFVLLKLTNANPDRFDYGIGLQGPDSIYAFTFLGKAAAYKLITVETSSTRHECRSVAGLNKASGKLEGKVRKS